MKPEKLFEIYTQNSPHMSWIKDRTILLSITGSTAYGTNTPSSDLDFKGVAIPPSKYFFSMQHTFDQIELKDPNPDAVIYDIRKYLKLASDSNPNILDVVFSDPKDQVYISPLGQKLLDNRHLFLSKRARYSYSGYAISQLKRIKLHKQHLLNPPKSHPLREDFGLQKESEIPQDQLLVAKAEIQKELDKMNFHFIEGLEDSVKIAIKGNMQAMLAEMKISANDQWLSAARKVGYADNLISILQKEKEYATKKREWDHYQEWKRDRNVKRAELEANYGYDTKHGYHLIRLMRMCKEILSTGEVFVKRPDFAELLEIRNGIWSYDKLIDEADKLDKECEELYQTSTLPNKPDINKIDQLCIELIEESLK